jgi:hypothetical protein
MTPLSTPGVVHLPHHQDYQQSEQAFQAKEAWLVHQRANGKDVAMVLDPMLNTTTVC